MIKDFKHVLTALSLIAIAGCSFHSAQWEGAKRLLTMRISETQTGNETYWWDMEYERKSYRLFPVAWKKRIVLTDGSRWMIVMQNSDVLMIRDLLQNQQISFENAASEQAGLGSEIGADSSVSGRQLVSMDPRSLTKVSIIEGPVEGAARSVESSIFCYPSRFVSESLRLVTNCYFGAKETSFRMVEFDQFGNIVSLKVNIPSRKMWTIYRSNDLVDAPGVKRFLDGDVDEI